MSQKYEYFGKYILLEKLAMGGMAEVWLARAPGAGGIGKFVAMKKILPQYSDNPEFIQMFKDEAAIAMNLSHSNIVSIYEFGQEKSQLFLVMDYVEGRNLRQILNKLKQSQQKFSTDQIIYAIKEVAAGLDHAHRSLNSATGKPLNITHRDMSPQNIMITFEGEVRIVDFGIAKAESQMEHTRTGTLKGKFGYMSPEQAEGQTTDLRTDIFSLGICLWEMLANERLFVANNEINTLRKIRECNVPSLTKINPSIHPELERITMKALTRDRNLRYQTAAAMHRDLNRFLNRQYPDFSPHDFSVFIKTLYTDEILELRKRLIEYAKIPFRSVSTRTDDDDKTLVTSFRQVSEVKPNPLPGQTVKTNQNATKTEKTLTATETFDSQIPDSASDEENPSSAHPDSPFAEASKANKVFDEPAEQSFSQDLFDSEVTQKSGPHDTRKTSTSPTETKDRANSDSEISLPPTDADLIGSFKQKVLNDPRVPKSLADNIPGQTLDLDRAQSSGGPHRHTRGSASSRQKKSGSRQSQSPINLMIFVTFTVVTYVVTMTYFPRQAAHFEELAKKWFKNSPSVRPSTEHPKPEDAPSESPSQTSTVESELPEDQNQAASESKATVGLVISSVPAGAEIFINGINTGKMTPDRVEVPAYEPFSLRMRLGGYIDYTKNQITTEKTGKTLTANLQRALVAYVDIDVKPPVNTKLYVDGVPLRDNILPINKYAIPAGTPIVIRAENPLTGATAEETVTLRPDQRYKVLLELGRVRSTSSER